MSERLDEIYKDLFERIKIFLDEIKEEYKDKNILLVTHGGVARAVYFYFILNQKNV